SGLILRRSGTARSLNVYQVLPTVNTGLKNSDAHPLSIQVTTAAANRLLIYDEVDQTHKPGCVNQSGNCSGTDGMGRLGGVSAKTAGTSFQARILVTDQYYNHMGASSEPVVAAQTSDTHDNTESALGNFTLSGGSKVVNVTMISKGLQTLTAIKAGDESGDWNDLIDITVNAQTNSDPKKLLVILPGESSDPGSSTGKASVPVTDTAAGSTITITVYAADEFFNPYSAGDGITQPAVYLQTSDPYDLPTATVTLNDGTTNFKIVMYQASTQTVWARTATSDYNNYEEGLAPGTTNILINPDTAVKLQLLMPGELAKQGFSGGVDYSVSRTTGGKSGTPDVLVAGTTYNVTVNCVDKYFNRVSACEPTVDIEFSDDGSTDENDENGLFVTKPLIAGATTFGVRFLRA
ncbi:MAG: hypothetical protein AAB091_06435, partial [Elusimicrobiota bacterium]